MTRWGRTVLGGALGLGLMQLILSSSEDPDAPTRALVTGVFEYPGKWLRAFVDPTIPGLPAVEPPSSPVSPSSALLGGLSGVPLPTGTGSNLAQI
ncbi:hypothetical protein ACFV0D_12525 [Streptomyces sp. NPDC059556]|uniref:hypothetical protein n=1 Tax=Streptomyces sp. NPDC059556 TaxID=3346863 RepID=UPI00367FB43E